MSDVAIPSQNAAVSSKFFEGQVSQAKTLGSSQAKALGADPALAQWYQEAYAYYQQVSSGAAAMPDQAAWNEFLTQMNWAYEQLHGSSWDGGQWGNGDPWGPEGEDFGASQGYSDPYGGMVGTSGNLIHNTATADIGLLGGVTREIWSNEINVHIPSLSAQVEAVLTQDESVQPAQTVLKIQVTDPATGQTDTYIVHDYEDAKINVFTPTQQQLKDSSGLIQWKEFTEGPETNVQEGVSEPVETLEDGTYSVEATGSSPIDFTPPYDPENTEAETWDLYGDFNLNLRPSDKVRVAEGSPNDPDGYTVTITRKNGQVITIHTHAGYQGNINGNERNVTWVSGSNTSGVSTGGRFDAGVLDEAVVATDGYTVAGEAEEKDYSVPAEFADAFTLNGESNSEVDNGNAAGDSPTRTEDGKRVWDGRDFDIYSRKDGKENLIYARGKVTLHATSNQEYWKVSWDASLNAYRVEVFSDADHSAEGLKETFYVDNMVDELVFDVDPSHLTLEDPIGKEFDPHQIDTKSPQGAKVSILGEEENGGGSKVEWPSSQIQPSIPNIDGDDAARKLDLLISAAVKTGNWGSVQTYLINMQSDPAHANDTIRALIHAIYSAVGMDDEAFNEVMDIIPEDVRTQMVDAVTAKQNELNEKSGARWTSAETASRILETLDGE